MSDFAQHGLIATLQRLNDSHLEKIETELVELAKEKPIALILPCHARDLTQPALAHILAELEKAKWLADIVLSLNGYTPELEGYARKLLGSSPIRSQILWIDSASGRAPSGKGANFRAAVEFISGNSEARIIATQDCDVTSFRRIDLARLCYATAHPELAYTFAKAYYSRVTDRLYGRVSRLFLQPFLHAAVSVAGHRPLIDFLLSFRYPLAGEVAMTRALAESLPAAEGWGIEISHLCHIFRSVEPRDICQVDGGGAYDHKHQPIDRALAGMAAEIARELFSQFALEGIPDTAEFRSAVASAYRREANHALRRSASLARINALPFDIGTESETAAVFLDSLELLDRHDLSPQPSEIR
jgi:glucosyl-3-phosphoglycerate synthase